MAGDGDIPLEEEDEADLEVALTDTRARVQRVLSAFHGRATEITDAGRENMRTVNRLSRVVPLRYVKSDRAFRHNISRYRSDALDEDILIGARREGQGVWTLVAELTPTE